MRYIRTAAVLALTALTACAWKRTPVPIISDTGSSALLVGTWSGAYSSAETGRNGSITFEMASEKDTAFCDVVMVPKFNALQGLRRDELGGQVVKPLPMAQPLKIRFIRLGEGRISGTLDPYLDPECGCSVKTTFEGTLTSANTIAGTFITRGDGVQTSTGTWKVNRQDGRASTQ
jgi:hypothetical protein